MRKIMQLNKEKLHNLLKMYRLKSLGDQVGLNYQTIYRLSKPSQPVHSMEVTTAYKLAKGLGITLDEFVARVYDIETEKR